MRVLIRQCFASAALAVCSLITIPASAQNAGALDTTFGGSGRIDIKLVAGNSDQAITVINYPGRRYLALGRCHDLSGGYIPCLARFNDDGSPDTTFGTAGQVVSQLVAGYTMQSSAVALQPDGKIVVAGTCTPSGGLHVPCHLRLNANGQIDGTYGNAGSVVTTIVNNVSSDSTGIAVQSDGKVVVGGTCFESAFYGFCAWRYLATGAIDATYGTGGNFRLALTANNLSVAAMAMQPDNSIVLAGYCDYGAGANVCLVRATAGGVRDTSFVGGAGAPTLPHHAASNAYEVVGAMALQADGQIVIVGNCVLVSTSRTCAARVTTSGALDASFGGGWVVVNHATLGTDSAGTGVAVQRDGKIAVASACIGRIRVCTLRLNSDGSLDGGYGTGGVMGVAISGFATEVAGALLDADERLLVAGGCYGNDGGGITDTCIYRVLRGQSYAAQNCTLDVDDDGTTLGANDVLIVARVAMGFTGAGVTSGMTPSALARRTDWPGIRDYLVTQCGMTQLRP